MEQRETSVEFGNVSQNQRKLAVERVQLVAKKVFDTDDAASKF